MRRIAPLISVVVTFLWLSVEPASYAQFEPQSNTERLEFEVASVKPNASGIGQKGIWPQGGGRIAFIGLTVKELVRTAYGKDTVLMANQVTGGPGWVNSETFDIVAVAGEKAAPGGVLPRQRMSELLRTLLQDRFELATHTEMQQLPIYGLVLDRSDSRLGKNLRRSTGECTPFGLSPPTAVVPSCGLRTVSPTQLAGGGITMDFLAGVLAQRADVGRVVRNQTNLRGSFDLDLEFSPLTPGDPAAGAAAGDASLGPSLFTALKEQLGLRLDSQRGPVEVVFIDRAQRPAPN